MSENDTLAPPEEEPERTLSAKQLRDEILVTRLGHGDSPAAAADVAGCGERTVRRLLREDRHFIARVHAARRARLTEVNAAIPTLVGDALRTLNALMESAASETTRMSCARILLAQAGRLETEELSDRIRQVEDVVLAETGWVPEMIDGLEPADDEQ